MITPEPLPCWINRAHGTVNAGGPGYNADWFRDAMEEKGSRPCIPGRKSRGQPVKYDKRKYKQCNRIEIIFGRHTLGQMSDSLLLRYLSCCKRHLLAMNPEPKRLEILGNYYHWVP